MAIVKRRLDPTNPPKMGAETRARLAAMSQAEIDSNAASDPDNPPMSAEELGRMSAARITRRAREKTGLTQARFAERYRINVARLRDWEQGRFEPDSLALAYLTVIERAPGTVARLLSGEGELAAERAE